MGDILDFERGKLCIGRKVKLTGKRKDGRGWHVATLKAAFPRYAKVRPAGHGHDELVPWSDVEDWVAGNDGPAPKPARVKPTPTFPIPKPMPVIRRMPELTALEHKELKAMTQPNPTTIKPPTPSPAAVAALKTAMGAADMTDLGNIAERVETARRNLVAARKMVEEAKAEEAAAVKVFDELRAQARRLLDLVESAATGGAA